MNKKFEKKQQEQRGQGRFERPEGQEQKQREQQFGQKPSQRPNLEEQREREDREEGRAQKPFKKTF